LFIVVYDPPAAEDLLWFLWRHGFRAWQRTPFVIQIDGSPREANVERLVAEWNEGREGAQAELLTLSRIRNLTRL
jgi:hypothetical protein